MPNSNLKEKYHEVTKEARAEGNLWKRDGRYAYTFAQLQALRDMAKADVYPDGNFSDEECNVWSMFHSMSR